MPDIGHVVVGLLAGRWYDPKRPLRAGLAFSAVSLLPDLDLAGRALGVSDASAFGHRGAAHSLAAAALIGAAAAVATRSRRAALFAALTAASHGALDMLDTGPLGVAWFWPLSSHRYFWPWRFLPGPPPGEHWLTLDGARAVALGAVYFLPLLYLALRRPGYTKAVRIPLLALLLLLPGASRAQGLTAADRGEVTDMIVGLVRNTEEMVKDAVAGARAGALIKGDLEIQRASGRPPLVDRETAAAELRSMMRLNTGRLGFGRRWRPWPSDEAFAKEAEAAAKKLEALAAGLGPVRGWQCAYDKKADAIMNGRIGPLASSSPPSLTAQAAVPPQAGLERAFRFGPQPGLHEPLPARDESSARWLDWAAGQEVAAVAEDLRAKRQEKKAAAARPDEARLREAIRLWRRAAALEKGGPAPADLSAEASAKAAKKAADDLGTKYGRASTKVLVECAFEEAVAAVVAREAGRR